MKKLVLLAPVAALVLAGCAQNPTVAAKVGGREIPVGDVTIVADYLCASATQGHQVVPMIQVNELATTYLIGAKALVDLAARSHVTIPSASTGQADPLIAKLASGQRARAAELLNEVNAAARFFVQQGASSSQQILSGFVSVIQGEAKAGRFTANPAYPTVAGGTSGSLSTAVSSVAKAATASQPTASYSAALPTGQKCG